MRIAFPFSLGSSITSSCKGGNWAWIVTPGEPSSWNFNSVVAGYMSQRECSHIVDHCMGYILTFFNLWISNWSYENVFLWTLLLYTFLGCFIWVKSWNSQHRCRPWFCMYVKVLEFGFCAQKFKILNHHCSQTLWMYIKF